MKNLSEVGPRDCFGRKNPKRSTLHKNKTNVEEVKAMPVFDILAMLDRACSST